MWTDAQRAVYRQEGTGFPSDLTDAEWERLVAIIPAALPSCVSRWANASGCRTGWR